MEWAQAATVVTALAAFTGLQGLWISRSLDRVYAALDRIGTRLDRVDVRLDLVEGGVLREHGERIARIEASQD